MRLARNLLVCLAILIALLLAAAFSPVVQTWVVERELAHVPGLHASVGSVWAGLSSVEISNARLERNGAVLAIPELDVRLPVTTALFHHKLLISHLVAKGWTLDLSHQPVAGAAANPAGNADTSAASAATTTSADEATPSSAQTAPAATPSTAAHGPSGAAFDGILNAFRLPVETTMDDVALEGDVVFSLHTVPDPVRVHTILVGGGVAPGKTATFSLDAAGTPANSNLRLQTAAAHGQLHVSVAPTRNITQIEYDGSLGSAEESLPRDFSLRAAVAQPRLDAPESYTVALQRAERTVASVTTRFDTGADHIAGTWKIDLRNSEILVFLPHPALPTLIVNGNGTFDTDATFHQVHASGHLTGTAADWVNLSPALAHAGRIAFASDFDALRDGASVHVTRFVTDLADEKPLAHVEATQPFSINTQTGIVTLRDPSLELARVSKVALPASWLPRLAEPLAFASGEITGNFSVTAGAHGVTLHTDAPLRASGISVLSGKTLLGQDIDVSTPLRATYASGQGWAIEFDHLNIAGGTGRIVSLRATLRPLNEAYRTVSLAGTFDLNLDTMAAQPGARGLAWIRGQTAKGDFKADLGSAADITANVKVTGHDAKLTAAATIGATIDDYGSANVHVPLTITSETGTSRLSLDGTYTWNSPAKQIDLTVTGDRVDAAHLALLAGSLRLANGQTLPDMLAASAARAGAKPASQFSGSSASSRDAQPFWGALVGRVRLDFHQLEFGDRELNEAAASLGFAPDALQLNGLRASFNPINTSKHRSRDDMEAPVEQSSAYAAQGELTFHADAEVPYALKASGSIDAIDGARLFGLASRAVPASSSGDDETSEENLPVIEGQWAVSAEIGSSGRNLPEVVAHRVEHIHLTSTGGAVRLLKTNIGDALPDAATPVSDAVANVGSKVGWLFGVNRDAFNRENHLSKGTEAILDFSYRIGEIPFQKAIIDASRGADQTIHLDHIEITAPNQRLTGSGQITFIKDTPIARRPLTLEMKLGVRGPSAAQLAATDLLSPAKDADGYIDFRDPLPFSGTLAAVNNRGWHDLLARAAVKALQTEKKTK